MNVEDVCMNIDYAMRTFGDSTINPIDLDMYAL